MFVQMLRYLGSLVVEPIVRISLNFICRVQGFGRKKIGLWLFIGPADFLELVDEAKTRLETEDPELLNLMTIPYTVMYSGERFFSFPLWRYGGISDGFTIWKSDGVLAAWLYLYYHSLAEVWGGRWKLSVPRNSIAANKEAKEKARQWLLRHRFPDELCEAFQ